MQVMIGVLAQTRKYVGDLETAAGRYKEGRGQEISKYRYGSRTI